MMTSFILVMLGLMSCTTDDPEPIIQDDPRTPVMPVADFKMWPTPTIDDSNLTGEYYVYTYWREHKGEAQTGDELFEMCNIPQDLLKNMSTPNLAWTCFKHPYGNDWPMFNNVYDGILSVITRFNGYEELMKRRSGVESVLDLFTQIDCVRYVEGSLKVSQTEMISWTLVLCTAADYSAFNREQVARLAQNLRQKDMNALLSSYAGLYEVHYYYCLLGALIVYHYDDTLPVGQRVLLANFIRYCCNLDMPMDEDLSRSFNIIYSGLDRLIETAN